MNDLALTVRKDVLAQDSSEKGAGTLGATHFTIGD